MRNGRNMAEGGYEPETTNPFDPHGDGDHDDGNDNDNIPLIPIPKEKPPSHKYPSTSTPIQHSSTSTHNNPSYVDTPSGKLLTKEVLSDIADGQIKNNFPNTDTSKYFSKIGDDGDGVYIKIKKGLGLRNVWHPIIDKFGDVMDVDKLPKTLRDALGKTAVEIVKERVDKVNEADERIKELKEQRKNAFPEDRKRIDAEIERNQEIIDELIKENEAMEGRLSLRSE